MEKRDYVLGLIGNTIRSLREAQGLSQEEFSIKAGLDRAYYGGVERGERNVSALNLVRIASTLDVEIGELFPGISDLSEKDLF